MLRVCCHKVDMYEDVAIYYCACVWAILEMALGWFWPSFVTGFGLFCKLDLAALVRQNIIHGACPRPAGLARQKPAQEIIGSLFVETIKQQNRSLITASAVCKLQI